LSVPFQEKLTLPDELGVPQFTIYMRFTAPSTASLLDDKENGYTKYLFQNKSYASGTYTISGEVDGPAGLEHLTLSSTACASTRTDSVTISIQECGGGVQQGETSFYGTALYEPGLIGATNWTVRIDGIAFGVDIRPLGEVTVYSIPHPDCHGRILSDIQPGDTVWVYGYFNGSHVTLCPSESYYITTYGPPI